MTALDYAPPTPWHRRRKFRRVAVWGVVLALLGIAAWKWGPGVWRQIRISYWQNQVMNYSEPPGTVRYTYTISGFRGGTASAAPCATNDSFREALGSAAAAGWHCDDPVIFLHARRSKVGERLIGVSFSEAEDGTAYEPVALVHISTPATMTRPPRAVEFRPGRDLILQKNGEHTASCYPVTRGEVVKVYAGQASATDEAAFEIAFDIGTRKFLAKFRLREDARGVDVDSVEPR